MRQNLRMVRYYKWQVKWLTNDKLSGWVRITIQTSVSCGWTAHFLGLLAFFGPSIRWRITACPRIQKCFRSSWTIKNSLVDWFIDWLLMVIESPHPPFKARFFLFVDQKRAAFRRGSKNSVSAWDRKQVGFAADVRNPKVVAPFLVFDHQNCEDIGVCFSIWMNLITTSLFSLTGNHG